MQPEERCRYSSPVPCLLGFLLHRDPSHPILSPAPPAAPPYLQWLVWVQLACTLQSARICFLHICPSPAFSGPAAQAPLRRMATAAGALRVLLPTPGPLADGGELLEGRCAMTECINLTCGLLIVHGSSRLPSHCMVQ